MQPLTRLSGGGSSSRSGMPCMRGRKSNVSEATRAEGSGSAFSSAATTGRFPVRDARFCWLSECCRLGIFEPLESPFFGVTFTTVRTTLRGSSVESMGRQVLHMDAHRFAVVERSLGGVRRRIREPVDLSDIEFRRVELVVSLSPDTFPVCAPLAGPGKALPT